MDEKGALFLCMHEFEQSRRSAVDIGGVTIRNRVFLAPMSGVTDEAVPPRVPMRHGAGLVVSEMVASGELAQGPPRHAADVYAIPACRSIWSSLPGARPHHMAEAARIAAGEGADIIDINMGCPAKKVTGGYAGSALMRDLDHALTLIEAVVGAVKVPVTVKMRLGWDESALNAPLLARRAEQAGVQNGHGARPHALPVLSGQGRLAGDRARQGRRSPSPSSPMAMSARLADAAAMLEQSGADAVMVGRASYGAPWIVRARSRRRCRRPTTPARSRRRHGDRRLCHRTLRGHADALRRRKRAAPGAKTSRLVSRPPRAGAPAPSFAARSCRRFDPAEVIRCAAAALRHGRRQFEAARSAA